MRRAADVPGVATCLALITLMDVLPRVIGMRRTFALAFRSARQVTTASGSGMVSRVAQRVALAAAFYPRRALCLEQSLAMYVLLRRRGIPAELKLGVQPRPFYAHAWVEVNGAPVNEERDLPMSFTTFAIPGA